ncbi:MAG: DUF2065 domain-containing protein [Gammaproteobacteria bacterium]
MFADLLAAVALMLVFEGIMPFLNPARFRRTLLMAAEFDDRSLRLVGLAAMGAGVVLLYVVR